MNFKNEKFKLSDQQISTSIADETVILNHDKGMYFGLNEMGTEIWKLIELNELSFSEIVDKIKAEFEVSDEQCKVDVTELLNTLIDEGLVEKV